MKETISRQAEQYRNRAEEVRTTAENMDMQNREALRRLASGYDRLAENLERVAARAGQAEGEQKPTGM